MNTWDQLYALWSNARTQKGDAAQKVLQSARKRVSQNTAEDWQWLRSALLNPQSKWFVALVFRYQSVPKRIRAALLRAGVYERNPSHNREFIEPCVRSYGSAWVQFELLKYLETGTDEEKAGAASALYWSGRAEEGADMDKLREAIRCQMLREFVDNEDLNVRRRIIPMLRLAEEQYPEESRPLVKRAVEIARSSPDDYIRHRVEIQLGKGGPYMAIPDTGSKSPE